MKYLNCYFKKFDRLDPGGVTFSELFNGNSNLINSEQQNIAVLYTVVGFLSTLI